MKANIPLSALGLEDIITELKSVACLLNAISLSAGADIYLFEGASAVTSTLIKNIELLEKLETDLFAPKEKELEKTV